jgi:hypothetical protein
MSQPEFRECLLEQYQGELIGEVFFSELIRRFQDPETQYKLGTLLQIETETAARLRPAALELGVDLFYRDDYRKMGEELLRGCDGMDWQALMHHLDALLDQYVRRYAEIAEMAPPEYKELADSMVVHEESIQTFARREASGDTEHSLDAVIAQLAFPLKRRA